MIEKVKGYKNKYILTGTSCTSDMWKICKEYEHIRCLICNKETSKRFGVHELSASLTINNSIEDNVFF